MEELIAGPLARALEAGRPRFNALFAQARHHAPALDAAGFAHHLREIVAPVVEAVARTHPEQVAEVVDVLYEFSLELIGKDLPARYPTLAEGWGRLLLGLPQHLASAPRLFAGSITNALYNLAQVPDARPREWADDLLQLGSLCSDVPTLLEAGKVCAWRAGLAHLRDGALDVCGRLPPELARAALGAAARVALGTVLQELQADPWLDPAAVGRTASSKRKLRIVRTVGAFRGFGGSFLRPPRVAFGDGHFQVTDGERCWLLLADRFGATLHPAGTELPRDQSAAVFQIDRKGAVRCNGDGQTFTELREPTSHASSATTLAVTVPLSHAVYLVARSAKP